MRGKEPVVDEAEVAQLQRADVVSLLLMTAMYALDRRKYRRGGDTVPHPVSYTHLAQRRH